MGKLSACQTIVSLGVLCAVTAIASPAQTLTTLANFNGTDGASPRGALVQGFDGNFYGVTVVGGAHGQGTVFEITPGGKLTTLYSFCAQTGCTDGENPVAGLIQATNGKFYGTTSAGGANGQGTVFEITPGGKLTTLHSFETTDGSTPQGALVEATRGKFYGTTTNGGAYSYGTVFEVTDRGELTTLYSFCAQTGCTDGEYPVAGLVQATDGKFYGTTPGGGANNQGTVFEITRRGELTTLYSFGTCPIASCPDEGEPTAGLIQAINGRLYGTTVHGGAYSDGSVFEFIPGGELTTLHSFDVTDGYSPQVGLVQATNGTFYGTTVFGGADVTCTIGCGGGTVFEITADGQLTTLHSFEGTDGYTPFAPLLQATDGNLYGSTYEGGANSSGLIFKLSVGLGPFVETRPTSGRAGETVFILGNDLTCATRVTFNGAESKFKVVSISKSRPSCRLTRPPARLKLKRPESR